MMPATAFQVANAMYRSEDQVLIDLRRAERLGLVVRAVQGWVPLAH